MRLRDRDPERLDPRIERELAAVDAARSGLAVDDDLAGVAEIAALASEDRPSIDAEFAALLDERAAAGFPRDGRALPRAAGLLERLRAIPPRRLVAPAFAAATLLVVVGVAITALGGFGGGSSSVSSGTSGSAASRAARGATPTIASGRKQFQLTIPGAASSSRALGGLEDSGVRRPVPNSAPRRVSRSANLTLSTDPDKVRSV